MKSLSRTNLDESPPSCKTTDEHHDAIHKAPVDLTKRIAEMRNRFRPDCVRILFVAESPPQPADHEDLRFFYNPAQKRHDNLFHSIMKAVFPEYETGRHTKGEWLERFKDEGCFLIDATDMPINRMNNRERNSRIIVERQTKTAEIRQLSTRETSVILIKKNVFRLLAKTLNSAGVQVLNKKFLPFPSHGHERRFVKECRALISVEETNV
jgi:hypothetical protein